MTFSEVIRPIKNGLIACAFVFYLLPFIYRFIPDETTYFKVVYIFLHYINTACIVITSVILTCRHNFRWYYPLTVAALFMPTVAMYYNAYSDVAILYVLIYTVCSYVAWPGGVIIRKILENNGKRL